eukprot:Pgem_evm1s6999
MGNDWDSIKKLKDSTGLDDWLADIKLCFMQNECHDLYFPEDMVGLVTEQNKKIMLS